MTIILRIDVVLAQRKMKSKDLAAAIGVTEANLSKMKMGRMKGFKLETLDKICDVLDCQPGDLLEHRPAHLGADPAH